jgi:hypothetical protein
MSAKCTLTWNMICNKTGFVGRRAEDDLGLTDSVARSWAAIANFRAEPLT